MLDVRVLHPLGPDGRRAGKYTLTANEKDKYERYPTHKDGRRLTNATIVPIAVTKFLWKVAPEVASAERERLGSEA